jgi:polyhydroxyalkanoate synthase
MTAAAWGEGSSLWQGVCNLRLMASRLGGRARLFTPHDTILERGSARLVHFERETPPAWAEPLLICTAPVAGPGILDLGPGRTVVRRLLDEGFDIYLVAWGPATAADRSRGLSDLVCGMLKAFVERALERSRAPRVQLMGYCLGGTLAAAFTALQPESVKSLALIAAPIDFAADRGLIGVWTDEKSFDVDALIDRFGHCPEPLIWACIAMTNPMRILHGKYAELAARLHDAEYVESFAALENWAKGSVAVPGEAFRDMIKWFYRQNALATGRLDLGGRRVRLERIGCPTLLLLSTADRLVPPASTLGLLPRICSRDVRVISLDGSHEGLAVGSRAHRSIWPEAAEWIADHSTPRTAPSVRPGEQGEGRQIAAADNRSIERAFPGTAGPDVRAPGFRSGGPRAEIEENGP